MDVALTVQSKNEYTDTDNPYLAVEGVDCSGTRMSTLRMWGWNSTAVPMGKCVLRGMKVAFEKMWDWDLNKYVPTEKKMVEKCPRTAVEELPQSLSWQ